MDDRYKRNIPTLTNEESHHLLNTTVCIIGCGGIGGYVFEMLGRMGIGKIIVVDDDAFVKSNLNRQILSTELNVGNSKVLEAKKRMERVNKAVSVTVVMEKFNNDNGKRIIRDADIVVDAVDDIETRLLIEKACEEVNIPLVHGAISEWYGQVTTVFPCDKTLLSLYEKQDSKTLIGSSSFIPALIASIQVSEVIKLIIKRGELLRNKMFLVDLFSHHYDVVEI